MKIDIKVNDVGNWKFEGVHAVEDLESLTKNLKIKVG